MAVEFVAGDAPAWRELLDEVAHDIYHLPGYVELAAAQEPANAAAEARAIIVRDGEQAMFLPMIIRRIPGDETARDAISPYGYPGPLFLGGGGPAFVARASAAMVERLREEGIVSMFVRTHPLLNRDVSGIETVGDVVEHGETVSIDLSQSEEEIWNGTRRRFRSYINAAERAGRRAYMDEGWENEAAFVRMYAATMHRVGARAEYLFGTDYVRGLRAALGDRLHLCVVDVDGVIAAAGLFTEEGGIVQYHLSGTDAAFERDRPTMLMLHFVRGFMKARSNRVMHLGGGLGGALDSLFDFKAGFSKDRQPFRTWRVVVDPVRYAELSRARHPGEDPAREGGFFPLYRRLGGLRSNRD
jgi:Acetyltransferase (GNAT) domain